jgi:uncharacterized protein with von Willebrand factor type A (vWA) domain
MGSSLGLGQGMEYQYYEVPQPSQHLPQLRQARLQQLREERMRRQQRRMKPDVTTTFPFRADVAILGQWGQSIFTPRRTGRCILTIFTSVGAVHGGIIYFSTGFFDANGAE